MGIKLQRNLIILIHAYIKPLKDIEDIHVADGMGVVSKAIVVEVNMKEHPCDYRDRARVRVRAINYSAS